MNRYFAMLRYSKKLKILSVCALIDFLAILSICVFDVVQLVLIKTNSAKLSSIFIFLNILLISLALLSVILIILFIIIRNTKEKKHE